MENINVLQTTYELHNINSGYTIFFTFIVFILLVFSIVVYIQMMQKTPEIKELEDDKKSTTYDVLMSIKKPEINFENIMSFKIWIIARRVYIIITLFLLLNATLFTTNCCKLYAEINNPIYTISTDDIHKIDLERYRILTGNEKTINIVKIDTELGGDN